MLIQLPHHLYTIHLLEKLVMKNWVTSIVLYFTATTVFGADIFCSVVVNNEPTKQITQYLKFSGAYEERFELMQNSEFAISIHATGGRYFGISVHDKVNGSFLATDGKHIRISTSNEIQSLERLRVLCIQP